MSVILRFCLILFFFCLTGCFVTPIQKTAPTFTTVKRELPIFYRDEFWWGVSTSAYQNEDKGYPKTSPWYFKTDWDIFIKDGKAPERGDQAVGEWSYFDTVIKNLKFLKVNHFRFSIEWARIEPEKGKINYAALNQYVEMVKKLRAAGIEPIVGLWHFTFPSWIYSRDPKKSNFLNPELQSEWSKYTRIVVHYLKPYVRIYVPQNEPNGDLQLGWIAGYWPPGGFLYLRSYSRALKQAILMFRNTASIIRQERKDAIIIGVYSMPYWEKKQLLDPTNDMYNLMQHQNFDHLDAVVDVCDIIGVNYYYAQDASILRFLFRPSGERNSNYTELGWRIFPTGLYHVLSDVWNRYHKPIVITENGIGTKSAQKSILYFREHIAQMKRAILDGVDVRGYFIWTLVDNYEWIDGWNSKFGLFSYDSQTGKQFPTPSAYWFSEYIQSFPNPRKYEK